MSRRGAGGSDGPTGRGEEGSPPGDLLTRAFDGLRDELTSMLLYLLGNRDDAEDAAQEAFLKCWRRQETLPDVQNLRAFIFRVGLNAAKDMQRSAWHRRSRPLLGEETLIVDRQDSPGRTLEQREELDRLRQALLELRPEEKEVYLLRENGDFTYEEIAEIRQSPVGTVKTQMRSALQKLRKILN
jgi:RNA polymerase sigma-70 factor (ECF subfamily)